VHVGACDRDSSHPGGRGRAEGARELTDFHALDTILNYIIRRVQIGLNAISDDKLNFECNDARDMSMGYQVDVLVCLYIGLVFRFCGSHCDVNKARAFCYPIMATLYLSIGSFELPAFLT
jgi:hypothetical protein